MRIKYSILFNDFQKLISSSLSTTITTKNAIKFRNFYTNSRLAYNDCFISSNKRFFSTSSNKGLLLNKITDLTAGSADNEELSKQKSKSVVAERGYFDTHSFIKSLMANGFTQQQAEQLCVLFKDIVNYIAQDIKKECVTKPGQVINFKMNKFHVRKGYIFLKLRIWLFNK